ncbi:MAG: ATP-binding protein [Flavobacteriales bacterium]
MFYKNLNTYHLDFTEVKSQDNVKAPYRLPLQVGIISILIDPPNASKTMLNKRIPPSILPPLTIEEVFETTKIHSVTDRLDSRDLSAHHIIQYPDCNFIRR